MEFKDKVYLASKYAEKGYDYETLKYGDDLYYLDGSPEKGKVISEIWELVCEYKEEGSKQFRETYKDYKLY